MFVCFNPTREFCLSLFRLSERNCIEIITKLVQEKKLDVVHTLDGKEFITPAQISREIRDELYVHGGQFSQEPCYFYKPRVAKRWGSII